MPARTEDQMKQIALDIVDGKIFTDRHLGNQTEQLLEMVFIPLVFLGHCGEDASGHEKAAAQSLKDEITTDAKLIFEYIEKAGPRSINGFPVFFSLQWANQEETDKIFEYVKKIEDGKKNLIKSL